MKVPGKVLLYSLLFIASLLFLLESPRGEITSKKKVDPSEIEACSLCHKGSARHQIDDTRDPWCVPCHALHDVGTTLGLKTYQRQFLRISGQETSRPTIEQIIPQKMILIPAGTFIMGEDFSKKSLGPRHKVHLKTYYIDQYHVSNARYEGFVHATRRLAPPHWFGVNSPPEKLNHPVSFVSWFDADAYCRWEGKRLPTEAEWEKAARGTDGRMFPWGGNYLPLRANVSREGYKDTTPVDLLPKGKSPYGLYDMAGNLFQWTSDWFLPYPGNKVPHPNFGETLKVLRGGSFYDCSNYQCGISFQTFNRISLLPRTRAISAGFRCAKSAQETLQKPS